MRPVLAVCAAALFAVPSFAADKDGAFHVVGAPGAQTCKVFLTKLNDADAMLQFSFWFSGYVTAANRLTPETYNLIGAVVPADALNAVANTCNTIPEALVEEAVFTVMNQVYPQRQQTPPQ
jgi:hypothetical protein